MNKKNYIQNLSVLSSFAVVALHVNGEFWNFSYGRYWLTSNIIESLFYFAVPIFFMITGVTLLNYNERYSTKEFLSKRFSKTVLPFIIWSLLSFAYLSINGRITDYSLKFIVSSIMNTQLNSFYWFFIPLFSIYLSIPFLSSIPKEKRKSTFGYGIIIAILFNSLLPFIFSLLKINYNNQLTIPVISGFIVFVLIGYWIDNYDLSKQQRIFIYILGFLGFITHMVGTWYISYEIGTVSRLFKGYFNTPSLLFSVSIFTLFKYSKTQVQDSIARITSFFSPTTFGIYLTHWFVIQYVIDYTTIPRTSIIYRTLGSVIIFLICSLVVKILQKIPLINRVIPQ